MLKFGYARVSTQDQSLSLQIDALNHYKVDRIFEEKESGKRKNRSQLEELLKVLRRGDAVVVYKLDRISRSTKHLIELMEQFEAKESISCLFKIKLTLQLQWGDSFSGCWPA